MNKATNVQITNKYRYVYVYFISIIVFQTIYFTENYKSYVYIYLHKYKLQKNTKHSCFDNTKFKKFLYEHQFNYTLSHVHLRKMFTCVS